MVERRVCRVKRVQDFGKVEADGSFGLHRDCVTVIFFVVALLVEELEKWPFLGLYYGQEATLIVQADIYWENDIVIQLEQLVSRKVIEVCLDLVLGDSFAVNHTAE